MKYLLLSLALIGCTPASRQTQINVADVVSKSVNDVVPTITSEYRSELQACRIQAAGDHMKYDLCASEVDLKWEHFRSLWGNVVHMQDLYAKALETQDPKLADYVEWLQIAWCQLKTVAPFKLPEVPALVCKDE